MAEKEHLLIAKATTVTIATIAFAKTTVVSIAIAEVELPNLFSNSKGSLAINIHHQLVGHSCIYHLPIFHIFVPCLSKVGFG